MGWWGGREGNLLVIIVVSQVHRYLLGATAALCVGYALLFDDLQCMVREHVGITERALEDVVEALGRHQGAEKGA